MPESELFHVKLTALDHVSKPLREITEAFKKARNAALGLAAATETIKAPSRHVAMSVHHIGAELRHARRKRSPGAPSCTRRRTRCGKISSVFGNQ